LSNKRTELADFLKTRRSRITPEQVGLSRGTRRRTSGLRREEVAGLAGIGLTWYTWLEQGRDIQVSNQVLESIARVFQLTQDEITHLFCLAGNTKTSDSFSETGVLSPAVKNLMSNFNQVPTYMIDNCWNLVTWNKLSEKVFCEFSKLEKHERNILYLMFMYKPYMDLFDDWEYHARGIVSRFRVDFVKQTQNIHMQSFVEYLCNSSSKFHDWWKLHDVHGMDDVLKKITHPVVGKMSLEFVSFNASANPNLRLIFHSPAEGTDTKAKLTKLL